MAQKTQNTNTGNPNAGKNTTLVIFVMIMAMALTGLHKSYTQGQASTTVQNAGNVIVFAVIFALVVFILATIGNMIRSRRESPVTTKPLRRPRTVQVDSNPTQAPVSTPNVYPIAPGGSFVTSQQPEQNQQPIIIYAGAPEQMERNNRPAEKMPGHYYKVPHTEYKLPRYL